MVGLVILMKIMLVNTYYYPEIVGGAEYSVKKLAEGLRLAGHEVVVLCTGDRNVREKIDGIDVIRFKSSVPTRAIYSEKASSASKIIRRIKDIWNPCNKKVVSRIIREEKPDIVHTNGLYDISPVIWKESKRLNVKTVHTLRDYYLCCPLVAMECEDRSFKCKFKNNLCLIHRKANILALSKYVDYLTAPSLVTLNRIINKTKVYNIPAKVIPNAIDFDKEHVERIAKIKANRSSNSIRFVYLGTLSEKKGVRWLLDSFVTLDCEQAELFIAGKGELEQVVKDYCLKDMRIHYVGFLKELEMNELLMEMDILVCPSLWEEPFGRVVLDAYKHAMPVIASDRGALPELVKNNNTGKIVSINSYKSLSDAMNEYIESHETLLNDSKRTIKELENYSLNNQVEGFIEIYQKL